MKTLGIWLGLWLLFSPLYVTAQEVIRLWEGDAPGALGTEEKDIPTLTPFLPAEGTACGTAMVICPGGGYQALAKHEGAGYAEYLTKQGITCFVLKYRLGGKNGYRHPVMLQDIARAMRLVRSRAATYKIDPNKIGVMGSSAGGHLASTILTHFENGKPDAADPLDRVSSRPDFGVLCYAVISMDGAITHRGSKKSLLGENPPADLVLLMSNEKQVTAQTPPCFIWHTGEDKGVNVANSLAFAQALQANQVPYDLHVYQKGGHGLGLASGKVGIPANDVHPWAKDLLYWLRQNGWLPALDVTTP